MANILEANGVKKGDVVTIYMPLVPESIYAMLALCKNWCNTFGSVWWFFSRIIKAKSY